MPASVKLFDAVIDNALKIFRLIASEKRDTFRLLKELEAELVAKLIQEDLTSRQKRRVETFLKEVNRIINKKYSAIQLELDLFGIAKYVAGETKQTLQIILGKSAIKLPTKDYFAAIKNEFILFGAPMADWWRGQSEALQMAFAQQVRMGLAAAETNQQIISRIVGKRGEPGIMEKPKHQAAALVQTSVQGVANEARRTTFKANDDVIYGIQQVSTLDSHTSLICISYSGCQWDLEYKPIGKIKKPYNGGTPRHFNCRSVEIPLTKTYKELGLDIEELEAAERASETGLVPADMTFDAYLRRRGKNYQEEMLGVGKADLWRAGKITLKDLVSNSGRPLSLKELQELAKRR